MMNISPTGFPESNRDTLPALANDGTALRPEFMAPVDSGNLLDLRKIWSAVWRNRWIVLAILAVSVALGFVTLFLSNPIYRASASIEIDNQPVKILGTEDYQQTSSPQETDRLLQTQVDILQSKNLAEKVASDLNLAANDAFLKSQGVEPKPNIRPQQVIKALNENLIVSLPRNTRVVPVSFDSSDPALAAKIANRYVELLITGNLQRHFDTSRYSKEFLQNQLTLTKARLEQSEHALLDYARSVGIVDPNAGPGDPTSGDNGSPGSLTSSNLVDINQSLAAAKIARMQAQGRWSEAQSTPVMNLPEVLSNPAIQQMTQKRAELQSEYMEELQHRKPEHPAVQQAAAAIQELDRQIATLANGIKNSIRNQYQITEQQESQLSSAVSRLKGATLAEQQLGIRYNMLKREVDTNRELYDGLLQRYKEVSAEAGITSNNISVIDRADPPLLPISPRPFVNLTLALLMGMVVAGGVVASMEMFKDGIRSPEEVEERFGIPLLGHIPLLPKGQKVVEQLADPGSTTSEAYQTVRASVELSSDTGTPKTILVTSSRAGEGKSTTALAMAHDAAVSGRKVLLIDADMRCPSLHRHLNVPLKPGLSSFLTQQMPIESVIYETGTEGLSFMPAGPKPPSPAELVSGAAIRTLLSFLKERYDQIIVDSPPVLGLADAPRLASLLDATMLVIEANRSQRGAIDAAVRRLNAAHARMIGAVLVKLDPSKTDVGSKYLFDYYSYGSFKDSDAPEANEGPAASLGA